MRKDNITFKLFQSTMLTMLVAELSGAATAIIDGIVTGRYLGNTALAAHGIGMPYFSIVSIVSGILMVGSCAMCTRSIGKGDEKETGRIFSLTVLLGITLSIFLAVCGTAFAAQIASFLGAGPDTGDLHVAVRSYLKGIFPGAPGFIMFVILTPLLQLDGDSARPKIASAAMAVVDISGDLLNAFVFHQGMFGMGLASALSHYAALIVLLTHFFGKRSLFVFSLKDLRLNMIPEIMHDGLPRAMCMLCRGLLPIVLNPYVLFLAGAEGVAALSAMTSSSFVVGAPGWGIGGAMMIMGSMMVGEDDTGGLTDVVKSALRDIAIYVVIVAVAVFATAPAIASMYIPEQGMARDMTVAAIRCYAINLPFLALNVSFANYFQATRHIRSAHVVNICIEFVCTAAMSLTLGHFLGVAGVWAAFPAGQILLFAILVLYCVITRNSSRSGLAAYLPLDDDFGIAPEDVLVRSINTIEEAVQLSVDVKSFCTGRGIDPRQANRLALCVEELAGNVIRHGFADGNAHHLEIRIYVKDAQSVLRLRDDCRMFDLREYTENWAPDPEHPERSIGIRLVMKSAKDLIYTNTMNTNNLIIKV